VIAINWNECFELPFDCLGWAKSSFVQLDYFPFIKETWGSIISLMTGSFYHSYPACPHLWTNFPNEFLVGQELQLLSHKVSASGANPTNTIRVEPYQTHSIDRLLALAENIRQGWMWLVAAKTFAQYQTEIITAIKSFDDWPILKEVNRQIFTKIFLNQNIEKQRLKSRIIHLKLLDAKVKVWLVHIFSFGF